MPSGRGRKPGVRSGGATGGRSSASPRHGPGKYSTEVPQQRLTTVGMDGRAHTVPPAVMVTILGWPVSCEQKVRGSSPLAGSQLKGPRDHREGPLAPPWSHCGSHGISHRTGRCSALTSPSRSACVSARRRAFRMFRGEFAAYPASRLADRPRRRPVTLCLACRAMCGIGVGIWSLSSVRRRSRGFTDRCRRCRAPRLGSGRQVAGVEFPQAGMFSAAAGTCAV